MGAPILGKDGLVTCDLPAIDYWLSRVFFYRDKQDK